MVARAAIPSPTTNPSWQIYFYILHTGVAWGILTNGWSWRLYHRDTAHRLSYYYEVDLPGLLGNGDVEGFKYFYLFFRQASFIPNGEDRTWLDVMLDGSRDYAQGVGEDLKDQVYDALRHVAQGFLDYPGNELTPDGVTLRAIHDNSLILLYRLLFILYAESRDLLPVRENETYRLTYSLDAIKKAIEQSLSTPILSTSPIYWTRLQELFGAINRGNEHLGVPAYNGDLFDSDKHPFLARYVVGDQELRQAIDLLARTKTGEGRVFVDYRDLEVRHLGSIYEGLLEYQLRYAEEDLAVVKERGRERYVPTEEGREVAVSRGRVYLVTDRGERKATGSYYTPDYIVKYIVEQTLKPLLDEVLERWAERKGVTEQDLVDDILTLDVLDPAMGSGHFLVEATEYIARYLVGLGLDATVEMRAEAELDYWKRRVVQACIYGVDLNPLAVELAKLSLWLTTVSKDRPLSFLDHHLRCGNSLIGARVADLGAAVVVKRKRRRKAGVEGVEQLSMLDHDAFRQSMMTAVDSMWLIERTPSDNVAGVKEQERIYQDLRHELTRRYRRLANLNTACHFGVEVDPAMWPGLVSYATGHTAAQVPQYEEVLRQAGIIADDKRFFHWELEFPEVFFDEYGRQKRSPGFEAVVGNPQYVQLSMDQDLDTHLKSYLLTTYGSSMGRLNTFGFFVKLGLGLTCETGYEGMIVPNTVLTMTYYAGLREMILDACKVQRILTFDNLPFEEAVVENVVLILQVVVNPEERLRHLTKVDLLRPASFEGSTAHDIPQRVFVEWHESILNPYLTSRLLEIRRELRVSSCPLGELVCINQAIALKHDRAKWLFQEPLGPDFKPLLDGRDMGRYETTFGGVYLKYDLRAIHSCKREDIFLTDEKLFFRRVGDRIIACYDDRQFYALNTLVVVNLREEAKPLSLRFLLALLNSRLLSWYFVTFLKSTKEVFSEIQARQMEQLPICRISFATSAEEREKLQNTGMTMSAKWIGAAEVSSVDSMSFSSFNGSDLGRCVVACLTANPEQSDVVHDVLAHLAEHMIAMNKEKQTEVGGFLGWVADFSGLPVEDWTLKTHLKAYYQYDWAEVRRVLDRNSRKITKVNVKGREASDLIRGEWGASVDKLEPLLARIAATDRLIDLIVYRLYGLTEEEVALVEAG